MQSGSFRFGKSFSLNYRQIAAATSGTPLLQNSLLETVVYKFYKASQTKIIILLKKFYAVLISLFQENKIRKIYYSLYFSRTFYLIYFTLSYYTMSS